MNTFSSANIAIIISKYHIFSPQLFPLLPFFYFVAEEFLTEHLMAYWNASNPHLKPKKLNQKYSSINSLQLNFFERMCQ